MKKNKKGMSLVEVMVAMILATYAVLAGTAFFVRAFRISYDYSEYTFKLDRAVNFMEQKKQDSYAGNRFDNGTPYMSWSALRIHEPVSNGQWSSLMSSEVPSEFVTNANVNTNNYGGAALIRVGAFASWPIATENDAMSMTYNTSFNYGDSFTAAYNKHKEYNATELIMLRTYTARNAYIDLNTSSN